LARLVPLQEQTRWWADLAAEHGLYEVLLVLACHAALRCRRWWLGPDWPYVIGEFARRAAPNSAICWRQAPTG